MEPPFRCRLARLDTLKSLASLGDADLRALQSLATEECYVSYFFHELDNPAWLQALDRARFFGDPPEPRRAGEAVYHPWWPQSEYLKRIAGQRPAEVAEIILALRTSNPWILRHFLEAACQMPANVAARFAKRVDEWLALGEGVFTAECSGRLMAHLAEGGEKEAARGVLRALLQPVELPSEEHMRLRYPDYILGRIFREHLSAFQAKYPGTAFSELLQALEGAIRSDSDDAMSLMWRPAIEDHEQNRGRPDVRGVLIEAVRDLLDQAVHSHPEFAWETTERLLQHEKRTVRRIGLYILRLHGSARQELLAQVLLNRELLWDYRVHHEYFRLIQEGFALLNEETKREFVRRVFEAELEQAPVRKSGVTDIERSRAVFERLSLIADYLTPQERAKLDVIGEGFEQRKEPTFPVYTYSSWERARSPISKKRMGRLTKEELFDILEGYSQVVGEGGIRERQTIQLGRQLQSAVAAQPTRFARMAEDFVMPRVHPTYTWHLLQGLREASLREASKSKKRFPWSPVLSLCESAVEGRYEPTGEERKYGLDMGSDHLRGAVAELLEAGVQAEQHGIPRRLMPRTRKLLIRTLDLAVEPTAADEADRLKDRDAFQLAMTTSRGGALIALIRYALRRGEALSKRDDGTPIRGLQADVRAALDRHLDKSVDPSVAVHSVYGRSLAILYYLDKPWLLPNLDRVFPSEEHLAQYREAAWDSYLLFQSVKPWLHKLLVPHYAWAVQRLAATGRRAEYAGRADERLGEHLLNAYVLKLEDVEGDGPLAEFLRTCPAEVRAHGVLFLREALQQERPLEYWPKLRALWEARLDKADQAPQKDQFAEEIGTFTTWLDVLPVGLDDAYQLVERTAPYVLEGSHAGNLLEYAAQNAEEHAGQCVRLVHELVKQRSDRQWHLQHVHNILDQAARSQDPQVCADVESLVEAFFNRRQFEFLKYLRGS